MLFDSILPTVDFLSKLETILSNLTAALSITFMQHSKHYAFISTIFIGSFWDRVNSIWRNDFLCSSTRSNSSWVQVLKWGYSNSVLSSGSTFNSRFLSIFTTFAVTSSMEVWNFSKSSTKAGINFFQTPINDKLLTSSWYVVNSI